MDFKFDDFIEDDESNDKEFIIKNKKKKNNNNNLPIIMVVVISIAIGFGVYFISNPIFNKKQEVKEIDKISVDVNDDTVQIIYSYVTYGVSGTRNEKFIKENNVDLESFSNSEKFYYSLQFAQPSDFTTENKINSQKQKMYYISNDTIKKYMERFFGPNVTYQTDSLISYPFSFSVNGQNVGIMTYSSTRDSFETVFYGVEKNNQDTRVIKPYYTKLVEANKSKDLSYELKEKIIYTRLEKDAKTNTYKIHIYKDYNHTDLIDTKSNLTEEQLKQYPVRIDDYLDKASTITYNFKTNDTMLYFYSSNITKSN